MPNAADRTLAKWAVGSLVGSLGLVGVAKLGDAPKTQPTSRTVEYQTCVTDDGQSGFLYEDGLCLTNPPLVGTPDTVG
jgi:hypothetical protein